MACVAAALLFILGSSLCADDFSRTANGSFSSTDWYDNTTNMPPPQGPPGGGDTAALNDWSVSANSGSVMTLGGGGTLTVTGSFMAQTAMGFTLAGAGTLNSTNCSFINVSGGNLETQNDTGGMIAVSDGGSEMAVTVADSSNGVVSSGGSLGIVAGAIDLNLTLQSGGMADVTDLVNGQSVTVTIDGSGSLLTVGTFDVAAGFLDITNGGALTATSSMNLDGIGNIGGGGHWSGGGTTVTTTAGSLVIGDFAALPGFSLAVNTGAKVNAGAASIGNSAGGVGVVNVDGVGTVWNETTGGLVVGAAGQGTMNLTAGAHLVCSNALLSVGGESASTGVLTADGAASLVSLTGSAALGVGVESGSTGTITLTNGATFTAAKTFGIGVGGNGTFAARSGSKATSSNTNGFIIGSEVDSYGTLEVFDNGSTFTASGPITVGAAGHGFLSVATGGKLTLPDLTSPDYIPNLTLADEAGSSGEMDVSGATFTSPENVVIGRLGAGTFSATLGATVDIAGFSAPSLTGGQGTITVDGSDWTNSGDGLIGTFNASDPASVLTLQNDSSMSIASFLAINKSGAVVIDKTSRMAVGTGGFGPFGSLQVSTGGVLAGAGNVTGTVIQAAGGKILPGFSPGVITIDGDYTQNAGATYTAEIGGTAPGTGYDQINVSGTATLGGTLNVRFVKGFIPSVGQTFDIVSAKSLSGSFAIISQPGQASVSVAKTASGMTVTVNSVVTGAPVINSPTTVKTAPNEPFRYQISATNNPASFGATKLPAGLTIDMNGIISGTPTGTGASVASISATNGAGTGQADLTIVVDPMFSLAALPASNLLNISTRLDVLTDDNVLIGGFIITGDDPKKVLVRGLGPSLTDQGVSGALSDTVLELHETDGTVITNDDWQTTQKQEIIATGIPPTNPLESAIVATLDPGTYTAILRGKNDGTGIGLVEAYDIDQSADSQLANISTRGLVQTGDSVMIGGFIVGGGGTGSSTVVVRAIGPSLASVGVSGALANPALELHNSDGDIIAFNDDWQDTQKSEIQADKLAPASPLESAIEAEAVPGNYTAIVRGVNNTTGVGLVEVYNLQ
jgi:T5SS/PEP-CTERM-associated repeat protein